MPKPTQKFRPYLTQSQILRILELCAKEPSDDPLIRSIKQTLGVFKFKINEGITDPAYVSSPRQTIEEKLGFSHGELSLYDPVAARKEAYEKYCFDPANCTEKEIALAFTYKYEQGLMTDEERNEYETRMLG